MTKKIIGIDIADFSIEAVVLGGGKGRYKVEAYSRFRLSPDIIEDGSILNKDKLKDALRAMFQKAHPKAIEDKKVFLSVPESKVFSKVLSLPKDLKDKALAEAARHRSEELIPEIPENLVADMKILSTNGESKEVFYSAAELYVIRDFIKVFADLGIEVEGITTEALSSFAGLDNKYKKATTLLLDVGSRTTIASIFDNNGIKDSININIGGNNIIGSIADKLQISHLAAEEQMKKIGLTSSGQGETMLIIQGQLQPVADELKRFIAYYEESSGSKIEQIVLVGGLAQMKGIEKYFGDNLARPAYIGEAFLKSDIAEVNSTKYINALGLAKLAQEKPEINFAENLPKIGKAHKDRGVDEDTYKPGEPNAESINAGGKLGGIFKNIYVLIGLGVAILAILGFVFRGSLVQLYNSLFDNNSANTAANQNIEKKAFDFKRTITVSDILRDDVSDALIGKMFNTPIVVDVEDTAVGTYNDILADLEEDRESFPLEDLNDQIQQPGDYIIPAILNVEATTTNPPEEEFVAGDPLAVTLYYAFMTFAVDDMKDKLAEQLGANSGEDVSDLQYVPVRQTVDSYGHRIDLDVAGKVWR